jgi:hypothetical protein
MIPAENHTANEESNIAQLFLNSEEQGEEV